MFSNYFRMAWRSLIKNKISAIINIGGLSIGLAAAILIMLLIKDEFSYDRFHANLPDLYLVMKNQDNADGISTGDATAGPTAAMLRDEIPETKYAARVAYFGDELVRVGDKILFESGIYAEPDLFQMMSFTSLKGNPVTALRDAASIVVTTSTAKRLFGEDDPIGKTIIFKDSNIFKIGAVVKDVPQNSSIQFDMVLPFRFFERDNGWLLKWDDNRINTWVQLKPGANIPALNNKITKILQARSDDKTVALFAYPFAAKRLYQHFVNGKPSGGRIYMVKMMGALGLIILLIACINFMNLATAKSEHRSREVGIRKVLGASRKSVIFQFFGEAILMALMALVVGIVLAQLALPYFNLLIEKNLHFDFLNIQLWLLLIGIGLFTGLVAGSYPSVFLSAVNIVKVLKGPGSFGKKGGGLRRVLVTAQFVISIFLIIGTIVIFSQISYVRDRPIGYEQENLIDISATGNLGNNFPIFKNEIEKITGVKSVSAGSDNLLQFGGAVTGMDWPGKIPGQELSVIVANVNYNWTKTTGIKIKEGRDFDPGFRTDTAACLINETAVQKMGLKEPVIGSRIGGNNVIGVVQNFVFNNPSGIIAPMAIYLNTGRLSHFFVRIQNDKQWRQTIARIETVAKKLNPAYPFEFTFTREGYQKKFEEFNSYGYLASAFGAMAIFISCLGLFALSAFVAEKRSKEMSIRKVLGANLQQVWFSLSRDFLKPVFIAFLIVVPLAVLAIQAFLSNIPYRVTLGWWPFALAGLLSVLIALLTVSYQGIKTAFENPVTKLRNE